jgi:TrmH family RNA methyltransferase
MPRARPRPIRSRNATFQVLDALKRNRHKRNELGEVFIEGIEPIKQAVAAGRRVRRILCADAVKLSRWARELVERVEHDELLQLDPELYRALADREEPSELMVTVADAPLALEDLALGPSPLVLVFDRPSDHGNLGTTIRSANAFGVDAVITTGHGVDVRDPKAIRASMGAVFRTPVVQVESVAALESWLARERARVNLRVVGTDSGGETPSTTPLLRRPCALVMGNEALGMSAALRRLSDATVAIPMRGQVDSLNVACAASILLWQIHSASLADAAGARGAPSQG